jgi:3-hydroxyisobutyrate dehydrogenase-like beta-hydroxyacid dehydrogenase
MTSGMTIDVAIIGLGEAGSTFVRAAGWKHRARGWDVLPQRRAAMAEAGISIAESPELALADAPLVLSLVTADEALSAAESYARQLVPGALWCDCNSVAPATKQAAAQMVEAAGGRYVDVAIMAPVHPAHLGVPLLLAGAGVDEAMHALRKLGFTNLRGVGAEVGRASAIKMIRSVMVKGLEALSDEMMTAAAAAGVTEDVLVSLDASADKFSWRARVAYNLERMATHGARRAAEMEETAKTLLALGVVPVMTQGTIRRQRDAAARERQP